jgi:prepilin-type N-terminal cleavage/methylation domain-containing protein
MNPAAKECRGFEMNRISKGRGVVEPMNQRHKGTGVPNEREARVGAFTLIELLAVIAIIALLAGLVLGTAGLATTKSREARMKGELAKIQTGIEDYKAVMGNFPQDNQDTNQRDPDPNIDRHIKAGMNPLFYELSGCTFDGGKGWLFTTQNKSESVSAADIKNDLGVKGIENSARNKRDIPFHRGLNFKANEYSEVGPKAGTVILVVPLPGPYDSKFPHYDPRTLKYTKNLNPWFYDSSSTNRHNMETYDLWTEYLAAKKTNVLGNW